MVGIFIPYFIGGSLLLLGSFLLLKWLLIEILDREYARKGIYEQSSTFIYKVFLYFLIKVSTFVVSQISLKNLASYFTNIRKRNEWEPLLVKLYNLGSRGNTKLCFSYLGKGNSLEQLEVDVMQINDGRQKTLVIFGNSFNL